MEELKTSCEWQILCKVFVIDADGWDRKNYNFSWFQEKITKEEFEKRLMNSTCKFEPNAFINHDIWKKDDKPKMLIPFTDPSFSTAHTDKVINYDAITEIVKDFVEFVDSDDYYDDHDDHDYKEYIFETVLSAYFGKDIWKWIKQKC